MEGGEPLPALQERRIQLAGSSFFAFSITFVISTPDCCQELSADAKMFSSSQRQSQRREHQVVRNECDKKCNLGLRRGSTSLDLTIILNPLAFSVRWLVLIPPSCAKHFIDVLIVLDLEGH
ncbi:hypothetical protein ARMGADRAFT_1091527 [Armillaria gallica]|uniref:Uncharacterized protein n=1 Tax=Armillaria gallica TaxID=47427 RepID=A0A2H3CDV2_ARMGA|nr:hypothetical protein ARMGADRAFT_1091527 [Armillaria gallica]